MGHAFFLGFNNDFVLSDYEDIHVEPFAALRELRDGWIVRLGTLYEFPTIVQPEFLSFISQLSVYVLHNETWSQNNQSAVNVRWCGFLLNVQRVNNEAVWF